MVSWQARGEMLIHSINIHEHTFYVRLGTQNMSEKQSPVPKGTGRQNMNSNTNGKGNRSIQR